MTCGGICMRDFAEISSKLALAHTERRSALEDIYALRLPFHFQVSPYGVNQIFSEFIGLGRAFPDKSI